MGTGKVAATIVLIIAAAAALLFAVKRLSPNSGVRTPPVVMVALIDVNDGQIMAKPRSEWEKLGEKGGMFLNPLTNEHTMVAIMRCSGCGDKIPRPSPPAEAMELGADPLALLRWQEALKCPKCGKNPFELPDLVETP